MPPTVDKIAKKVKLVNYHSQICFKSRTFTTNEIKYNRTKLKISPENATWRNIQITNKITKLLKFEFFREYYILQIFWTLEDFEKSNASMLQQMITKTLINLERNSFFSDHFYFKPVSWDPYKRTQNRPKILKTVSALNGQLFGKWSFGRSAKQSKFWAAKKYVKKFHDQSGRQPKVCPFSNDRKKPSVKWNGLL
ncbi:hypothetical protein BpHYR1_034071 [Brachionus plicatilis]|uniref:Uncharacterized protein n=1 Tax=Brachionus plicatilis TaxID=10195 RepID=A0A3M7R8E1_BRAPC|nr:hypothetical protein BpHYR1_034071 [Brachionus plicatilis]